MNAVTCKRCEPKTDENCVKPCPGKLIICRDFLRNLCKRGNMCKYFHSEKGDGRKVYVFCHDFQNGDCSRLGCKFIHCSVEDEEHYNKTGELLPHVYEAYRKIVDSLNETGPACKDYFKGKCKRETCKYKHLSGTEKSDNEEKHVHVKIINHKLKEGNSFQTSFEHKRHSNDYVDYGCDCKRRRIQNHSPDISYESDDNRKLWVLESENEMLRHRLSELTKRNRDLQATNEFLLEQNARLRIGEKTTPSLTAVTVPTVTITNTRTLPQGQMNMQQPQMLRTVAASVATVPVSLAAVAATPVSIATVSMAPVQIPPVGTVAQMTHTQEGSLQQETTQLVSYPIISRSATILQGAISHH